MDVRNKVFISYAHEDSEYADDVRKHLATRLRSEALVWVDTEIQAGDEWEAKLESALCASNCALMLLSVDYLNSRYIAERELPRMLEERTKGMRIVPVLVRECSWCEDERIATMQLGLPPTESLSATRERSRSRYESAIERLCKTIADQLGQLGKQSRADTLKPVDKLLASIDGLEIHEAKHGGDNSVVYKGTMEGREVAVKLMMNPHLARFGEPFRAALKLAANLEHPCFIPLLSTRYEPGSPAVLILPWIEARQMFDVVDSNPPSIDSVARFLARAAEALSLLHDRGGLYGVITPDNVFVEERFGMIRFPAISIFGFLSCNQPWAKFLGNKPDAGNYMTPEQYRGAPMTAKSDQYALGQLALEMLCGTPPVNVGCPADLLHKEAFFTAPEKYVIENFPDATWSVDHPRLAQIVFRMMRADPAERWASLHEVANELRDLEEEARTVAKAVYMDLEKDAGFFERFYERFFERSPSARSKFDGLDMHKQAEKLRGSMIAVLNFHDGAEPTTLHAYVDVHRRLDIGADELDAFEASLLECLKARYAGQPRKVEAWAKLLAPAMEYMKRNCTRRDVVA